MATPRHPRSSDDPEIGTVHLEGDGPDPAERTPDLSAAHIARLAGALLDSIERGELEATVAEVRFLRSMAASASPADSTL